MSKLTIDTWQRDENALMMGDSLVHKWSLSIYLGLEWVVNMGRTCDTHMGNTQVSSVH